MNPHMMRVDPHLPDIAADLYEPITTPDGTTYIIDWDGVGQDYVPAKEVA